MIYLDNAATSYPKPRAVADAMVSGLCVGNAGRGGHRMAAAAEEKVFECRGAAAELFGGETDKAVFTNNATTALNMAIKGLIPDGSHIITSDMEHNSVRRPVYDMCKRRGCTCSKFSTKIPELAAEAAERLIGPKTRAIVCNHASNIVNRVLPLEALGELCERRGLIFIVDASQSAGKFDIDMRRQKINALAMAGHKGLMGPMGSGLLLLRGVSPGTILEGGSGSASREYEMPQSLPDRLEAGTLGVPAIAGLLEGIRYVRETGAENIRRREEELCALAVNNLRYATVYERERAGSNLLFNVDGKTPAETSAALDAMGICTRSGLHCAPDAHESVGTREWGAVRASFGAFNTREDALCFAAAVNSLN